MKIEILGTGCYNCVRLESLVDELLQAMDVSDVQVVRISDEQHIRQYITLDEIPGLVINGQLASTRELPSRETLQAWLEQAGQIENTAVT